MKGAIPTNEEIQSRNEEVLILREELRLLNVELTVLKSQLQKQERLDEQRVISAELKNILFSTEIATLFLDLELRIRFYTPLTRSVFRVISSDVGRPLKDLSPMALNDTLDDDAKAVLANAAPEEREVETKNNTWFHRRISPYRTQDGEIAGVVITLVDITARKHAEKMLEEAKTRVEHSNAAKSRFLFAASHDLRQLSQTLELLRGLQAKSVKGEKALGLVARLSGTVTAMAAQLSALFDIDHLEAGVVRVDVESFVVDKLLSRMRDEFRVQAQANGLDLRVLPCRLNVMSDIGLLEQMMRNLVSNALRYTKRGKVLLGCRRRGGILSVEVWASELGLPSGEKEPTFEAYSPSDCTEYLHGGRLGLGLSSVQRLGSLLGHQVHVCSRQAKGSMLAIEVPLLSDEAIVGQWPPEIEVGCMVGDSTNRSRRILVVEDDPGLLLLLELLLKNEGHLVATASSGSGALEIAVSLASAPDLLLTGHNLPNGLNGLELAIQMRIKTGRDIPVIILTGDTSTQVLQDAAHQQCLLMVKPVKRKNLLQAVRNSPASACHEHHPGSKHFDVATLLQLRTVYVVDDDSQIRGAIADMLENDNRTVRGYGSGEEFMRDYYPGGEACLLIDAYLPGMNGLELLEWLRHAGHQLPAIMITGRSDVSMAVRAMKAGASDFIEKPVGQNALLASIDRALDHSRNNIKMSVLRQAAASRIAGLTRRERQIMELVLAGHPNKNIAADLGISQRTIETHRASIMRKTGSTSLPALARLALAVDASDAAQGGDLAGQKRYLTGT